MVQKLALAKVMSPLTSYLFILVPKDLVKAS